MVLERLVGYPRQLLGVIGHPVMWMGALIAALERRLNAGSNRKRSGILMLALLGAATAAVTVLLTLVLRAIPLGWIAEAVLATTLLAQKELGRAVRAVAEALGISLQAGRLQVSQIVGRDPETLDQAGV